MNIVFPIKSLSSFFIFYFLFSAITANAEPVNKSINPAMVTINKQPPLNVYWKERGGQILIDTVCFDYAKDTREYRGCRKLANEKFNAECERFSKLYKDSRPYYDKEYQREMKKYCSATEVFVP